MILCFVKYKFAVFADQCVCVLCSKGGIYLLNLVDFSVGGFPLLFIGLLELIAINWVYGAD